ncbi:MAG: TonB-dependent receptor plug domain-containing protein [Bdellovibrionaceae bacterium]|nr:TonB-dependent receptor plug domain-containing protein [Pseudobdellovibrionaceae bacterium]
MQRWILLGIFFVSASSWAQDINIDNLSLDDLLNMKTSVASKTEKTTRQAAGIVTIITKDEIKKMGARDLIDVLMMVPGINFNSDVQGQVGLSMRGNWANEGKFSFMVDGQEMNEILYSGVSFGNHFPVDHIKRIEIIRGPGSAIYGGYAELAVINMITEKGADINGAKVTATYGQMREDYGRRNLSVQVGKKLGEWDFSLAGLVGEGRRGDGPYVGYESASTPPPNYNSETYDFADAKANNLNPGWLNFGANNGAWDIRLIYDNYSTTTRAMYGYSNGLPEGIKTSFESTYASLKYDYKVSDNLIISPYLNIRNQEPWKSTDPRAGTIDDNGVFDITAQRTRIGAQTQYAFSPQTSFLFGAEIYKDEAKINNYSIDMITQETFAMTGTNKVDFDGIAAYTQLEMGFELFDITLGARYEKLTAPNGRDISQAVPRFAITKANNKWHLKGLASQAYRTPSIFNFDGDINLGTNGVSTIKPEVTTTFEAEGGIALTKTSYLTANVFSIQIKDAIIYATDGIDDFYSNSPEVATMGFEIEYRKKLKHGFTTMNYSYYQKEKNTTADYEVPGRKELLGIPQHKWTYIQSLRTGLGKLQFNPSIVYLYTKYSYELDIAADAEVLRKLPSVTLVNLYFTYPDLWLPGLELGFGVFNLFDEENRFVQPYNGELGNTPAPSREFLGRLTYSINF